MVATASSMGMNVAGYMGRNIVEIANEHNACVVQVEMGTYYTDKLVHTVAEQLVSKVTESKPDGGSMNIAVWAESWGTNFMQRVLNDPAIKQAKHIQTIGFIIESAPSGEVSAKGPMAQAALDISKETGFKFGSGTLWLMGAGGMFWQYWGKSNTAEFLNTHLPDLNENNAKTSPRLVGDQTYDIAVNGFPYPTNDSDNTVPVYAILWSNDSIVDNDVAIPAIRGRLNAPITTYTIDSGGMLVTNHAECWKGKDVWTEKCRPVLRAIFKTIDPPPYPPKRIPK